MSPATDSSNRSTLEQLYRWAVLLSIILLAGLYAWGTRYQYHRAYQGEMLVRVNRYTGATYRLVGEKWKRVAGATAEVEQDGEKPTPAAPDKQITPEEIRDMAKRLPQESDSL